MVENLCHSLDEMICCVHLIALACNSLRRPEGLALCIRLRRWLCELQTPLIAASTTKYRISDPDSFAAPSGSPSACSVRFPEAQPPYHLHFFRLGKRFQIRRATSSSDHVATPSGRFLFLPPEFSLLRVVYESRPLFASRVPFSRPLFCPPFWKPLDASSVVA